MKRKKEIREENGKKRNDPGLTDPGEEYFANLTGRIMNRVDDYEELKEIAPFLSTVGKNNPFSVPEGYFESLQERTEKRITSSKGKIIYLRAIWISYAAAAAAILFAVMIPGLKKDTTSRYSVPTAAEVSVVNETRPEVIAEHVDETILEEHITHADLDADVLTGVAAESETEEENFNTGSDAGNMVAEYVIENSIDLSTVLYEE